MRLAILSGILGLVAGYGASILVQPDALPYTEPHHEFPGSAGEDCVAWDFATVGAHVIICEGQPPMLIAPKRTGYSS